MRLTDYRNSKANPMQPDKAEVSVSSKLLVNIYALLRFEIDSPAQYPFYFSHPKI